MPELFQDTAPLPYFSRHDGLLDHELLSRCHIACIGVGGASALLCDLARCGIETFTILDSDKVSATNVGTQGFDSWDIGVRKVDALREKLIRINPAIDCLALPKLYEEMTPEDRLIVSGANVMLAMTDHFATQALINEHAINNRRDTIFAIANTGMETVEVTATFPDNIAAGTGCHRCHTKARYDAYRDGFQNPSLIPSHALAASFLNSLLAHIIVGRLHQQAGSPLAIASIAAAFAQFPCLIARITPQFAVTPNNQRGALLSLPFSAQLYALDTPLGWICPDCGTPGVVGVIEPPETLTKERSTA